jgi:hypothetical protein
MFAHKVKEIAISFPFLGRIVDSEAQCRAKNSQFGTLWGILHVSGVIRGDLAPGIVPEQLKVDMWGGRAVKS